MDDVASPRGKRMQALVVDHVVVWAMILVGAVAGTAIVSDPTAATSVLFFSGLLYVPLFVVYKTGFEGRFGQTLGKAARDLTVRRTDGSRCSWGSALYRNVVLIVDFLPVLYFLGLYLANRTEKRQRLGDLLADTVVVEQGTGSGPGSSRSHA